MFAYTQKDHPPVRAVIWDLDGMVIQISANENEMSVTDLESLVQFILAICQNFRTAVLSRESTKTASQFANFEKLLLPLDGRRRDDLSIALRRLKVPPQQSVIIGIDPQRLTDANQMGFQIVAFQNPRQVANELLSLLAEPLAV